MGAGSLPPFEPTQEQFDEWCERHDMRQHLHREAFEDAASLYLTAPRPTASGAAGLPTAWFCVNSVTGKMLYTDSRDEATNMRDQKRGHWTVTPLTAGEPERATANGAGGQS